MALSRIWVSMICVALAFGAASGRGAQLGAAAAQGVQQAVDFCLTVGGMICLWSGVMELMRRCRMKSLQLSSSVLLKYH